MESADPVNSASRIPEHWKPKIRWFTSEYLIVVAGVLTAFALSAWWQSHQDSQRERTYLEQLSTELRATQDLMDEADSASESWELAQAKFIRAFHSSETTPVDSLYKWVGEGVWQPDLPNPILASAKALISTGDLGLIRNDQLKFEISKYVEFSELTIDVQLRYFDYFFGPAREMSSHLSRIRIADAYEPFELLEPDSKTLLKYPRDFSTEPFSVSAVEILNNRAVLDGMIDINIAHANARNLRSHHRTAAVDLLRLVEQELDTN